MRENFCPFAGGVLSPKRENFASVRLEPEPQNGPHQPLPLRTALRIVRSRRLALPHGSGRGLQVRDPDHPAAQDAGSATQTTIALQAEGLTLHPAAPGAWFCTLASHPCARARRVDALALSPCGSRARRPSRQSLNVTHRHLCASPPRGWHMPTPHSETDALATVQRGGEWGVEVAGRGVLKSQQTSPPSPVRPLCPIRVRSTMAAPRGGGPVRVDRCDIPTVGAGGRRPVRGMCLHMKTHDATGPCVRWLGRGRARRVGSVFGAGRAGAAGDGAPSALRDRGRARRSRGADAARDLRVFGGREIAVSLRLPTPIRGASR